MLKDFLIKNYKIITLAATVVLAAVVVCICIFSKTGQKNVPTGESLPESSATEITSSEEASSVEEPPEVLLVITSPKSTTVNTTEPNITFTGSCDNTALLTMNGNNVEYDADGLFSISLDLNVGKNTFTFIHKEQTITYTVNYRYVIISSFEPSTNKSYSSGTTIVVSAMARAGSNVTATFNGSSVTMQKKNLSQEDEGEVKSDTFVEYVASFTLPEGTTQDVSLGKVKFTATYNGMSESFNSGNITVKKSSIIQSSDPSVTPQGGSYTDVGSGLIATITRYKAETFDINTVDDWSRPTLNYLPEGTMDYCAEGLVTHGKYSYYKLRCGRRIYEICSPGTNYASQVATVSIGTLPDHNEITALSFENEGQYSVMKFDCLWKAPFYFDILNQSYRNPSNQDYFISNVTFSYIDITFCYATVFNGDIEIPQNHPIFKKAEIIKNTNDYTLRLYLNKTGGFYGWDCYYDNDGKLTFEFLNPAKMENHDSLKGIKIYINVGHGGKDQGAAGFNNTNTEAERNLYLARLIRDKLTALGATVQMSRDSDVYMNYDEQALDLRAADAHYAISIHHNANTQSSPHGFAGYYFTPFSKTAIDYIDTRTANAGIYNYHYATNFHYFFLMKNTNCPIVLTENGFMSNKNDWNGIASAAKNDQKATAIVEGILDYFRSIQ